ncbi:MAG: hypothetical protein QOD75_155 [Blastocatellia bacterium]|nr:hypothetical protein [Blastocatellia bacterium]
MTETSLSMILADFAVESRDLFRANLEMSKIPLAIGMGTVALLIIGLGWFLIDLIYRSPAIFRPAITPFFIRVMRAFVVDGDFFAGLDVTASEEKYVPVKNCHIGVRLA